MVCSDGRCAEAARQGQNMNRPQTAKQGRAEREVHHPGNIAGSSQAHWFSLLLKGGCFRRILATCIGRGKLGTNYVYHSSGQFLHDAGPVRDIERKRNFPEEDGGISRRPEGSRVLSGRHHRSRNPYFRKCCKGSKSRG